MKLPKIESLIIIAFFGIVALWAISKCSSKRSDFTRRARETDEEQDERPVRRDSAAATPAHAAPLPATQVPLTQTQTPVSVQNPGAQPQTATPAATPGQRPVLGAPPPQVAAAPKQQAAAPSEPKYSTLYVTIDGLKLRKEPNLKGAVVTKLELYEPVYFLNQKTEKIEEISLGYEKVKDHWVKIRTKSGKEGWVFGAGVHYYKMKRKGVME